MTTRIDDRLTKVLAFEAGTTYGSYTVISRTPCYITFEGESRKKISIVNGVEVVKFPSSKTFNSAGEVTASGRAFTLTAFRCPELAEAEPAFEFIGAYDNRTSVATMSSSDAHAMATAVKVVEPSIQEVEVIAASLGYRLVNLSMSVKGRAWRLYRDGLLLPSKHYGGGLNLFDVRAYLETERYQKRFDIEVPSAIETCYSPALGSSRCVVQNITECGYAIASLLPDNLDEPDWFYAEDDRPYFDLAGLQAARLRMREELDCDRTANFGFSLGGSI